VLIVLAGAATALAGCGDDVHIEDELHPDTGRRPADEDGDVLHGPYATGSRFGVRVAGVEPGECEKLALEADDAGVIGLARDEEDPCRSTALATGPGHTTLRVLEGDELLHAVDIEVATATRATLHPRAMLAAGLPEATESWQSARVVVGTTATFTVRWWDEGGRELAAHELLVPSATDDVGLGAATGHAPNVDALQVTPRSAGTHRAEAGTAAERMAEIDVEAIEPDAVAELTLVSGAVPGEDDRQALLALGRDGDGETVLGLQPTWTVDGDDIRNDDGQVVEGDLFLYEEGGRERRVVATVNGQSIATEVEIQGTPSVASSNGCHGVPGLPAPASALAILTAAIGAGLASRLRRHSQIRGSAAT